MKVLRSDSRQAKKLLKKIISRSFLDRRKEEIVRKIVQEVSSKKDIALLKWTRRLDNPSAKLKELKVSPLEIIQAYNKINNKFLSFCDEAIRRVQAYEKKMRPRSWMKEKNGIILGKNVQPLEKVGIYVPGRRASYVSTVFMTAVPARLAGVQRIVMATPADHQGRISPYILVAANKLGIKEIFKIGGAQAIAALACGTGIVPRVDKIVGPGNIYVTLAKKLVYGQVDIDLLAGPTELVILCDRFAPASFVAADLLSQAEHDRQALVLCLTTSLSLGNKILKELARQGQQFMRKEINFALKQGAIIRVRDLQEGVTLINEIAAEHVQIMIKNPFRILNEIKNAGTVFLGNYSPVALGDYCSGPNHVLPTSGGARFFSPLSVGDFMKSSSIVSCNKKGFFRLSGLAKEFAKREELDAHFCSLKKREGKENAQSRD